METGRILVDTSVLIDYFRKQNKRKSLLWNLSNRDEVLYVSVITEFEFYCGCKNEQRKNEAKELFDLLTKMIFTSKHSIRASEIYNELRSKNQLIDVVDILLAGVASQESMTIATLNEEHFSRVDGLDIISSV